MVYVQYKRGRKETTEERSGLVDTEMAAIRV